MTRYTLPLIWCTFILCVSLHAQELTVKSFKENMKDLAARTEQRVDNNGVPCALVKVQLPLEGASFSGVMGTTEYRVNTYWAYMPAGSKRMRIQHPKTHTLDIDFSAYGIASLAQSVTYELVVDTKGMDIAKQAVEISFSPIDAVAVVNGEVVDDNEGKVSLMLPIGKHSYSIARKGYYIQSGEFNLMPSTPAQLNINLRKNPTSIANTNIGEMKEFIIDNESSLPTLYGDYWNQGFTQYENDGWSRISDFIDVKECTEAILQCNEKDVRIGIVTYDKDYVVIKKFKGGDCYEGHLVRESLEGVGYIRLILWDHVFDVNKISWNLKLKGNVIRHQESVYAIPGHIKFDDAKIILNKQSDIRFYRKNCCSNKDVHFDLVDDNNIWTSELIDVTEFKSAEFHLESSNMSMQISSFDKDKHIIQQSTTYEPDIADLRKATYIRISFYIWNKDHIEYLDNHPSTLAWHVTLYK